MSVISTPPDTTPRMTAPTTHGNAPRGGAGARWAMVVGLVIGAAGGAGVSAVVVHSQVHTRTVYVPVPSDPEPGGSGNLQSKV